MLSYEDLLHADLSLLRTAVADWKQVPKALAGAGGVAETFDREVAKGLRTSDWTGEAADAAQPVLARITQQLTAAGDEAHDVSRLLDDALAKFTAAQRALVQVDQQVNDPGSSVEFDAGHHVVLKDAAAAERDPDAARYQDEAVAQLNQSVQQTLQDATDADEALYWALSQDPNGSDPGFNADAYSSIAASEKGRAAALHDAATAARLARADGRLSDAQVDELNHLLAEHHDDPVFGAAFATRVGARGTLEFWAHVTDSDVRRVDDPAALKELQSNLGLTLASATHYPSQDMKHWENQMIGLGNQNIADNRGSSPLGFQVMSSLMHTGSYDHTFLQHYGNALLTTDKGLATSATSSWQDIPDASRLNYLGGSQSDPVEGYMAALDHNPSAATAFFTTGDHLTYCTQVRHWPDQSTGYTSLGHALMAATTGRPYGAPPTVDFPHHTGAEARLMKSVVNEYAQNVGDIPSGLSQSLGRMAGEYMPDFHDSLSKLGPTAEKLFPGDVNGARFQPADATRFLYNLGQTPDGYAAVSLAQTRYSADLVAYHLQHPHAADLSMGRTVYNIGQQGTAIQSVINYGRQDSAIQHSLASDSSFNKALGYGLDWAKAGVGVASGAVADSVTENPWIGGAVDKGIETAGGEAIDFLTSGLSADSSDHATYSAGMLYQNNMDTYSSAVSHAVQTVHLARRSGISQDQVNDSLAQGFTDGQSYGDSLVTHFVHGSHSTT